MIKYTWKIIKLSNYPQFENMANVAHTVYWKCSGTDGVYQAFIYSTCVISPPQESFTPYEELTEAQVVGWVWTNGVNKQFIESLVEQQIDFQINAPVSDPPLPWTI